MIDLNAAQQKRLGKLLAMGIPLPIAMPLALNPEGTLMAVKEATDKANEVLEQPDVVVKKAKRKVSAYSKKYKKEFRRIAGQYKNKNGTWKKGGFRKAVKAAHKAVKK